MKTLITAERLLPNHRFANLSVISNLALCLSLSLSPSSLSLIRMKTHLQSVGAKNQLVTSPSHYDNGAVSILQTSQTHTHQF